MIAETPGAAWVPWAGELESAVVVSFAALWCLLACPIVVGRGQGGSASQTRLLSWTKCTVFHQDGDHNAVAVAAEIKGIRRHHPSSTRARQQSCQ